MTQTLTRTPTHTEVPECPRRREEGYLAPMIKSYHTVTQHVVSMRNSAITNQARDRPTNGLAGATIPF